MSTIDFAEFSIVDMRVGEVLKAEENSKAKNPALILTIDFGDLGIKRTSAQITEHYTATSMIGRQVVAIVNLPPKRVAGIKSEVLVLASTGAGGTVLLAPDKPVGNGSRIA